MAWLFLVITKRYNYCAPTGYAWPPNHNSKVRLGLLKNTNGKDRFYSSCFHTQAKRRVWTIRLSQVKKISFQGQFRWWEAHLTCVKTRIAYFISTCKFPHRLSSLFHCYNKSKTCLTYAISYYIVYIITIRDIHLHDIFCLEGYIIRLLHYCKINAHSILTLLYSTYAK